MKALSAKPWRWFCRAERRSSKWPRYQKNAGHCLRGALERYRWIEEMKNDYSVELLCEAFCVSRSGFYDWLERRSDPSARAKEEVKLAEQIRDVHQQSRGTYETPRLHAELRHQGCHHSRKRIDRIRRNSGSAVVRSGVIGPKRPIAPMMSRSFLTGWSSFPKPADAIRSGSAISPISKPRKAGYT